VKSGAYEGRGKGSSSRKRSYIQRGERKGEKGLLFRERGCNEFDLFRLLQFEKKEKKEGARVTLLFL